MKKCTLLSIAASVSLGGSKVHAEVVRYLNPAPGQPGHFAWLDENDPYKNSLLDITRPSTDQPRLEGESVFEYGYFDGGGQYKASIVAPAGGGVFQRDDSEFLQIFKNGDEYITHYFDAPCGLLVAEENGDFHAILTATQNSDFEFFYSGLPAHAMSYVGVRFLIGDSYHYGWILIDKGSEFFDIDLDLVAWAYETKPYTPIVAGAPNPCCLGDLNTTPDVNVTDLFILLASWGTDGPGADLAPPADLVDVSDLLAIFEGWGACNP